MALLSKCNRFRISASKIVGDRYAHVEYRVLWVMRAHVDGLLAMCNRLLGTAIHGERECQIAVCRREIWIEVERALEFFHSSISVPPGNGNIAEREVCPRIAVVKLGRSFGKRRCLLS